jgi:hypothetical protein
MIILRLIEKLELIQFAASSETWVCSLQLAGIAGSKPGEKLGCLSVVTVVFCQVRVSATGQSLVQSNPTWCVCVCVCH